MPPIRVGEASLTVFERGWLSSNNILIQGRDGCALVDSGYVAHATQTVALTAHALGAAPLDVLINTHMHSDHCGGNAALQAAYPVLQTLVPSGNAANVRQWNASALTHATAGQNCPSFGLNAVLHGGDEVVLGGTPWQVHAAPGHDAHSVLLFEPSSRTLISADALWERGFGVVFEVLDGGGFDSVSATLDAIERLNPATVIPGHGAVFFDVASALSMARKRLEGFVANPSKHTLHAAKVLIKFKLMEFQSVHCADWLAWAHNTPYLHQLHQAHTPQQVFAEWVEALLADLVRSGVAKRDGEWIGNGN